MNCNIFRRWCTLENIARTCGAPRWRNGEREKDRVSYTQQSIGRGRFISWRWAAGVQGSDPALRAEVGQRQKVSRGRIALLERLELHPRDTVNYWSKLAASQIIEDKGKIFDSSFFLDTYNHPLTITFCFHRSFLRPLTLHDWFAFKRANFSAATALEVFSDRIAITRKVPAIVKKHSPDLSIDCTTHWYTKWICSKI